MTASTSPEEPRSASGAGGDELSELLSILWSSRWVILSAAVLLGLAGFGISSIMRPIYRADVVISLASESSGSGGLAALAGQFEGLANLAGVSVGGGGGSESLGILRSRALAERFLVESGLANQLLSGLDRSVESRDNDALVQHEAMRAAYKRFDEDIRAVEEDSETGLVRLEFEWEDREAVARLANEYVSLANRTVRERAILQSDMRLQYLTDAVSKTDSLELRQAMYSLIEAEVKSRMLASVDSDIAFRVIDPAVTPGAFDPIRPNKVLITSLAFIAGLFAAVIVVYVRGIFRSRSAVSA